MKDLRFQPLRALSSCAAVALLAGCGGSQPPGAMPQSRAVAHTAGRGQADASSMGAKTSSQELLYVSSNGGTVYVYSYPEGKIVHTLQPPNRYAWGECVDSAGDVFITTTNVSGSSSIIYEYAYGDSTPIATLSDPGEANGCAIDQTTGNLAVMNSHDMNNPYNPYFGDIAVYAGARGQPTMYYPSKPLTGFAFGTYDRSGNLYLSAGDEYHSYLDLVRLPSGSSSFEILNVPTKLSAPGSVQWDGSYVTFSSGDNRDPLSVYRFRIVGSSAKIIRTTQLTSKKDIFRGQTWIQGHTLIAISYILHGEQEAYFWAYPKGGAPYKKAGGRITDLWGVAVSVAQSR
jgi:hypothetical protein